MTSSCDVACDISPSLYDIIRVTSALASCDVSLCTVTPIIITLDGPNYILWSQAKSNFLKGRKLWRYVTGDIKALTQGVTEMPTEFIVRLEDWDNRDRKLGSLSVLSCLRYILYGTSWLSLSPSGYVLAISKLLSEETRLSLVSTSHVDTVFATPGFRGCGSSSGSRDFSASSSQSSSGSASRPNECTFCHATDHRMLTCPSWVCKNCHQRGPGHYRSDCPNNPTRRDTRPQSTAATAGVSSTTAASPTLIDVSDLLALVQQILSASGNPSTALSASTGSADGSDSWDRP
ncbi:hypothetical protein Acr_24g0003520 [Actinidia rufa]|uniref:CCHC-type domain-containing protein n=1 Tax=Actinidia rufa TaxID=165716 RepID=A0A7J0GTQ2_9ERIC|nr:hypothetical protein Acr_24g0003520 [Actinidia rufa]